MSKIQYQRQMPQLTAISTTNTSSRYNTPASPSGRARNTPSLQASLPPTQVIPRLYVSDLSAAESPSVLAEYGITHIVSAMRGTVAVPASASHICRLQVPLTDSPFDELARYLPQTTAFIAEALQNPRACVLVHCVQGVSRSASIVCAYLVQAYGYSPAQAVQYVKSRRPYAEPNPGFITQLGEYAESLRPSTATVGRRR
ncbi:hypothetical protein PHLCEN_2v2414 [Hermanssonia centrifuga]|uniref:protein-tyrosine-phosphatase n=1 Tax=Hermanssonia centrifuga TaxID=98765 RepID=A0A2R6RM45_9APHY|nr:hypothetical protein PHLCEN_2v2414 [Hermanssonia centrifuga]